jgi:hypothetical protein
LSAVNTIDSFRDSSKKNLEWILVVLSSILLGIWAVKGTIAFRNILLISGTLFSIYYIVQEWRHGELKEQCTIWKVLPILLLALTFVWVIAHYLFFSLDLNKQFQELNSTWLRTFMASIVGLGTGLALNNHPNRLNLLWFGILISFLVLFYQYIPLAIVQNKLLVPEYNYYLFHLKFNVALVGMVLIAGIDGALLDHFRAIGYRYSNLRIWYLLFWFLGTVLVLWTFVYIIDTRNGIGLSCILSGFWFIYALFNLIQNQMYHQNIKNFILPLISGLGLCFVLYFAFLQSNLNKGWDNFFDDVILSVQIDRYPHWQNLTKEGFPKHADGKIVTQNTYERFAWGAVGLRAIIAYPQGVGVLAYPLEINPKIPNAKVANRSYRIATHSGWVELGLAFGIPILGMIFSALLVTFINAISRPYPARMTVMSFIIMVTSTYSVTEATTQHGIEILYFLMHLISALLLTKSTVIRQMIK